MNLPLRIAYEGVARLARALASIAPPSSNKLVATFAARRDVSSRFAAFERDADRPLLWMHAPSVGEGLQARPVLEMVRQRRPATLLAYTYFSPSARSFATSLDVDFHDVLPFDSAPDVRAALAALQPRALVFSKLDVWPTLAREATARGVAVGLMSATLAHGSSRRLGIAAALLRDAYARLDRVGAISADDAERLVALGVAPSRITVTGDTRYDQVWTRAANADRHGTLLGALESDRLTLVAGSTWPSDVAVLLPAWRRLVARHPGVRLIIAPHEPSRHEVASLEHWARSAGLRAARLGAPDVGAADVIIVDRVGVLGDLYAMASMAYVGGAFHSAGLHSVVEPSTFGAPVIFGPRHDASRDAALLLQAGGARMVTDGASLHDVLALWTEDPDERRQAGRAARAVVESGLGAAERTFALVSELMELHPQQASAVPRHPRADDR